MMARLLQIAQTERWGSWWPRVVALLALLLAVGSIVVLGSGAASARAIGQTGAGAGGAPAGTRVVSADVHMETTWHGKDLELNVALTQTQNDCQAPLNGGVCLRYSVLVDEDATLVGYGVIPASDMKVTSGVIALNVDTRQAPGFHLVAGSGQVITITWQAQTGKSGATQRASVRGSLGTYVISNVTPSASANTIATILMN